MPVIFSRHGGDLFCPDDEWTATFALVEECKRLIESKRTPDGYRWNAGIPAGQAILHCGDEPGEGAFVISTPGLHLKKRIARKARTMKRE